MANVASTHDATTEQDTVTAAQGRVTELQEAMTTACKAGDVAALKQLIKEHGMPPGRFHSNFYTDLLFKAVASKQLEIVTFLLASDGSRGLVTDFLGWTAGRHPHAGIADLLCERYARDNNNECFGDIEVRHSTTTLTEALMSPDEGACDTVRVLLKHGAHTDSHRLTLPLAQALIREPRMPMDIIETMVARMKTMDFLSLLTAVRTENKDILQLCLSHPHIPDEDLTRALEKSTKLENDEMAQMIREKKRSQSPLWASWLSCMNLAWPASKKSMPTNPKQEKASAPETTTKPARQIENAAQPEEKDGKGSDEPKILTDSDSDSG